MSRFGKIKKATNAYANEKGFLAEGNFTASERNAIKNVTQKSLLNVVDAIKLHIGGTTAYKNAYEDKVNISTIVQNYDTAFYDNIIDKMFLLDVKQLNKVLDRPFI